MTPHEIVQGHLRAIALTHRVSVADILSPRRQANIVSARREAILTLNKQFGWGCTRLGRVLRKDHTTISRVLSEGKERKHEPSPLCALADPRADL